MKFIQKEVILKSQNRGFHLVTAEIVNAVPELKSIKAGMMNVFIKHTSASLTINENADPDVRYDMENFFNRAVPENSSYFTHTSEGSDDMPAHIKASMLGASLDIPVSNGRLNMGTWQGIYLCEHRNYGGSRKIVITVWGSEQ